MKIQGCVSVCSGVSPIVWETPSLSFILHTKAAHPKTNNKKVFNWKEKTKLRRPQCCNLSVPLCRLAHNTRPTLLLLLSAWDIMKSYIRPCKPRVRAWEPSPVRPGPSPSLRSAKIPHVSQAKPSSQPYFADRSLGNWTVIFNISSLCCYEAHTGRNVSQLCSLPVGKSLKSISPLQRKENIKSLSCPLVPCF